MGIQQQIDKIVRKHDLQLSAMAKKIMIETREELLRRLNDDFYGTYLPSDYERTYDLISAVDGRITKNALCDYTIEVFFDETKIHPRSRAGFSAHMGFDGKPFVNGIVDALEDGFKSKYNPRYGEEFKIISKTKKDAEKIANKLLKSYIK
ncbi:MAG: hypothetical protein E7441_00870 [Ruminococcaceae bacterium]|nr:hypothetical protein [Oscillospiraceae bacterium]